MSEFTDPAQLLETGISLTIMTAIFGIGEFNSSKASAIQQAYEQGNLKKAAQLSIEGIEEVKGKASPEDAKIFDLINNQLVLYVSPQGQVSPINPNDLQMLPPATGVMENVQLDQTIDNNEGNMLQSAGTTKVDYGDQYIKGKNSRISLKSNIEYTTPEGYTYSTDDFGRIDNAEGILVGGEAERNTYAQSVVGREDRLLTDEGGHLIARIFKGSGNLDNLVPMDATLNRGDWKAMENSWRNALENNSTVEVKIQPLYEGTSKRPVAFEVRFRIEGGNWKIKYFSN